MSYIYMLRWEVFQMLAPRLHVNANTCFLHDAHISGRSRCKCLAPNGEDCRQASANVMSAAAVEHSTPCENLNRMVYMAC